MTKDIDRPLLFGYYTQPFLRQQVNWTAKLPQEIKDELSDDMFKWLGLGPAANVGRTGDLRFMHIQYPNGQKAKDPETNDKGGAMSGYYNDRADVASAGERGYV